MPGTTDDLDRLVGNEPDGRLLDRYVSPFYLAMLGRSAPRVPDHVLASLAALGRELGDGEVVSLLRGHWRPQVMGGWFAAGRPSPDVADAVLDALRHSIGSLTAPVLATAAVLDGRQVAVEALRAYHATATADPSFGAEGFVAAAVDRLGARAPGPFDDGDRAALDSMLEVAARLRPQPTSPPTPSPR